MLQHVAAPLRLSDGHSQDREMARLVPPPTEAWLAPLWTGARDLEFLDGTGWLDEP